MEINIGDLVRILGNDWLGKPLGLVTEIKELTHDQSGEEYRAITAVVAGKYFTFGDESFELVSAVKKDEVD